MKSFSLLILVALAAGLGACAGPRIDIPPPITIPRPVRVKEAIVKVRAAQVKQEAAQTKAEAATAALVPDARPDQEERLKALQAAQAEQRKEALLASQAASLAAEETERYVTEELAKAQKAVDGQTGELTQSRKDVKNMEASRDKWRSWFWNVLLWCVPIVGVAAFIAGVLFSVSVKAFFAVARSKLPF